MELDRAQLDLLQQFERGLDPQQPERSRVPATVLGYGEISTVFAIQAPGLRGLAFKRLPLFRRLPEVERYLVAYQEYNRLLEAEIGIRLPAYGHTWFLDQAGAPVVYLIQGQLPADSMGSRVIHSLPPERVPLLVKRVLQELLKVWDFNRRQDRVRVGLDGQISNWALGSFDPTNPRVDEAPLYYLDTSTPLFRVGGVEQLDVELFLRSAPSFLVWLLRLLYLKDVVDRYYDLHLVSVDIAANFYKEQRPDLIPAAVSALNDFFRGEAAALAVQPVTEEEVRAYYREDALIWSLYLSMRKVDRFLRRRVLGRAYPYILPEAIKR